MLRPSDIEQLKGHHSRYAVAIGIAKRARDIVDQAKEKSEILLEKPVSMAIEDFKSGDYKIFPHTPSEDEAQTSEASKE